MIRPSAFVGDFVDLTLDCPAGTAVLQAAIDVHDVGRVLGELGVPPSLAAYRATPAAAPSVLILPCRRARHPERDLDVAAEAAIDLLERIVRDRLAGEGKLSGMERQALRILELTRIIADGVNVDELHGAAHGL